MNRDLTALVGEADNLLGLCSLLGRCPDDSARKRLVMAAHSEEALSDDETELLISALMLEAA
jgi:hypothetical protein